jgi:hypothetical protein
MKNKLFHRNRYFFLFSFSFFLLLCCSNPNEWINTLPKPWTLTEDQMSEILPQFHKRFPDFSDRLKAFSLWQVGKPYELFCLGEESGVDTDPIFRMDVSDCTVHILTSLASVQSQSWDEAKSNLIDIHYKPNKKGISIPTYKSRWHYTTNRIQENPSTVNITPSIIPEQELKPVSITLNVKENGGAFLDLNWNKPTMISYIPNGLINLDLLKKLPDIVGIAFVKKSYFKMGLVVAHEGMVIDQKNIIHASSEYGKTVKMNFMDYYFRNDGPLFDGVLFFEFHPLKD